MRLRTLASAALVVGLATATALPAATAASAAPTTAKARAAHYVGRLQLKAPASKFAAATSTNWFGYNQGVLTSGSRFTSISGEWVVPTATRHSAADTSGENSATWIGIGGGCVDDGCGTGVTDETLIQAGTEQDIDANGNATYDAWWEIIPEPETEVSLPVSPGDTVKVDIAESLPGLWSIAIDNVTTGESFTTTTPYPGLGGSAEWIEETPLEIGTNAGLAALPNLSTVHFSGASANGASADLQASQEMDLTDANGNVIAVPSAPLSSSSFDACTWTTNCL